MADIVERLRNTPTERTWDSVGRPYDYPQHLPIEAADEIDRLREALEKCQKALAMLISPPRIAHTTVGSAYAASVEAEAAARAALKGDA